MDRNITITLPYNKSNIAIIDGLREEISQISLSPIDTGIQANQIWVDGKGQLVKIKYPTLLHSPPVHAGEIIAPESTDVINYYDKNGLYFIPGTQGEVNPLCEYNLSHLLNVKAPNPGEYWIDRQKNVWHLVKHKTIPYLLASPGSTRTWHKDTGRFLYASNYEDERDLVEQVLITPKKDYDANE